MERINLLLIATILISTILFGGCSMDGGDFIRSETSTTNLATENVAVEDDGLVCNDKPSSELITTAYSAEKIQELKNDIKNNTFDYNELKSKYSVQCLRKTPQGYYTVLMQDDGCKVFVFMDESKKLCKSNNPITVNSFKSKRDFEFIKVKETTLSEITSFDKDTIFLPISSFVYTAHIVNEGVLIIEYARFDEKHEIVYEDSIVKNVTFYENNHYSEDNLAIVLVPYILGIDKNAD